jgi:hypothetical protein
VSLEGTMKSIIRGSMSFTADRNGSPIQARITHEALSCFAQHAQQKSVVLAPRHARQLFLQHHDEINRIAIAVAHRQKGATTVLITGADVGRYRQAGLTALSIRNA